MNNEDIRFHLALAYRALADLKLDDWTYTHLSALAEDGLSFFIYPFGYLFEEVTPECLIRIDFDGNVLEGREDHYNPTAYIIHGEIYKKRPDLRSVFHLHTLDGVAVSCQKEGLLPISQFALHFYGKISYCDYNSLALDQKEHGKVIMEALGPNKVMFLNNHGTLMCGATIHEAFFYTKHLENACVVQNKTLATKQTLITPSKEVCEKTVNDLLTFEKDLGWRDWQPVIRKYSRAFR